MIRSLHRINKKSWILTTTSIYCYILIN